ncbi:hypothetical protein [uncultured Roseobacter sp.]|uniref:hypothetical protein n=1 Tax=uncultured Roseobacter sp. TaxID=114847 RepID=UPI00262DBC8A|nr:hypothetical protein [uncultured Roseobacter sp.]
MVALNDMGGDVLVFGQTDEQPAEAATHRLFDLGADGFGFAFARAEAASGLAPDEAFSWVAIKRDDAGAEMGSLDLTLSRTSFKGDAEAALFAGMQTFSGKDTVTLRYEMWGNGTPPLANTDEPSKV